MSSLEDSSNFINTLIDEGYFDKIASYINAAKKDTDAKLLSMGSIINLLVTLL
jgi:1-pyrroline-5-carboxylate dehydrogenase